MSEQTDVKVFISWSGSLAKSVAAALREWLPLLFDRVAPWASDTDIDAGQRGLAQVEAELADTRFGIVVVTAENQHAPWLNFEAGALSKTIPGDAEHRVVPLLVDLTSPTQLTGPLAQFQAKVADRNGTLALLRSLAAVAGIDERVASERFDAYWPRLEEKVEAAKAAAAKGHPAQPRRDTSDVLDEILLHVRSLRSDSEAGANSARRRREAVKASSESLRESLAALARKHGFEVNQLDLSGSGQPPKVWLMQAEGVEYSQERVEAFEADLRASPWPDVQVEAIPF